MNRFNRETPDHPGVYYQSFAFVMKNAFSDILLWLPHILVKWVEGASDGLLTPETMQWRNFRGIVRGAKRRGVSHLDEIDLRRMPVQIRFEAREMELIDFYRDIARELETMGY